MVTLDLSRVDRKAQGPLELVSYLFPFGPTPSHILKPNQRDLASKTGYEDTSEIALCLQYYHDLECWSRCYGSYQWEMYLNGKRKRSVQNKMYPWKNKILICMDFTYITYLYNLAISKHLPTYSLTCLYCAIQFLACILIPNHEISSHKYILNIIINISLHQLSVSKHA